MLEDVRVPGVGRCLAAAVFVAASFSGRTAVGARDVKITDDVTAAVPAPWRLVPTQARNIAVLELPAASGRKGAIAVRVILSSEIRDSHETAIKRIGEIAGERSGETRFLEFNGWPAMERRAEVQLARVSRDDAGPRAVGPPLRTTVVTVAVCVRETVVRYEGTLEPGTRGAKADDVLKLANGLRTRIRPDHGQTEQDLDLLRKGASSPSHPTINLPGAAGAAPGRSPSLKEGSSTGQKRTEAAFGVGDIGEVQMAASRDGRYVILATNAGTARSTDFGATYAPVTKISWNFLVDGDPSVGIGNSGTFYLAKLGFPRNPFKGCADSVALSTDNGDTFTFVGHAAFCPLSGVGSCVPDQDQMAVDRFNAPAGRDELYMIWRHFFTPAGQNCTQSIGGNPFPMISCSQDGGRNWTHQTFVGTGDPGRIAVGPDGFVYVTYVAGSQLMIDKFSTCSTGLVQQKGFPSAIASINGVACPVPGLDRCDKAGTACPQPAVDDKDPSHVFVALADQTAAGNESVILKESLNGGVTWPVAVTMSGGMSARRFMPWVCTSEGIAWVTWYDRSTSTPTAPDLTAYFGNFAMQAGTTLTVGAPRNISRVSDPQCASGWPRSVDNLNDDSGCPPTASTKIGFCFNGTTGAISPPLTPCDPNGPACLKAGDICDIAGGCPKYGDYNGNACIRGGVHVAWASATPPKGVTPPIATGGICSGPSGINVFTDRVNAARCGAEGQPCCFQGATVCNTPALVCSADNTCVKCGGQNQPCCGQSAPAQCAANLVCNGGQCQCGGDGQPCCGASCNPGFTCNVNRTCSCGNVGEPCCSQNAVGGGTCKASNLVCDPRSGFVCTTDCGHRLQQCCAGDVCNFGLSCTGGTCSCGALNEACCVPGETCNGNLTCTAGHCASASSPCGQCQTDLQTCNQKCGTSSHCLCVCLNSLCACQTQGGCGPCVSQSCP